MKIINLKQKSAEWFAHRDNHDNASDAPVMMGASPYKTRNQLIIERTTGIKEEHDEATLARFARGHAVEEIARAKAEEILGEPLYPVVGISDEYPRLSASYDGLTMDESTGFECKLWNAKLAKQIQNGEITDPYYYWQLEQQILVGAERIFFCVCSDDGAQFDYMIYTAVPGRAEKLIMGWKQFNEDALNYVPEAPKVEAVGKAVAELPALSIQLVGEVKSSNLALYKQNALDFIESINTDLKNDQDFADAEKVVKFCDTAEKELEVVKKQALGQTASIEELFRTVDDLKEAMRQKRLALTKLVDARKAAIKVEILQEHRDKFTQHMKALQERLPRVRLTTPPDVIADTMKGKKTVASLREAAGVALANMRADASRHAEGVASNLNKFDEAVTGYEFLFHDVQALVMRDQEGMLAMIAGRIASHKAEEARKEETTRARIAAEEKEKAEAQAKELAEKERQKIAAEEREKLQQSTPVAQTEATHAQQQVDAGTGARPVIQRGAYSGDLRAGRQTKQTRPTDGEIIDVLALHFRVHESKVLEWLADFDFEAAGASIAKTP